MPGTPILVPDSNGRWHQVPPRWWNETEQAWTTDPLPDDPMVFKGSLFSPYVAQGTVMTRGVADMPLDPNSAAYAAWMEENTPYTPGGGFGANTALNTSLAGTQPIEMYVVDSTAPGAEFQFMDDCQGTYTTPLSQENYLTGRIPWPLWAVPAQNGDRGMAIYDIGTGIMREYFMVLPVDGKPGHWTATTGGWSIANFNLENLAETNYALQLREGHSAVAGMHNALGFIGIAEAMEGHINHALCFTTSQMRTGASWPARFSDGSYNGTDAPMEGQWCRLPMSVDPEFNPLTNQPYKKMTQLIIRALQEYGAFATDRNLFVHAFNGEGGRQWARLYGTNPWYRDADPANDGILVKMYGDEINRQIEVDDFPWYLTEWAPRDWGRPNPDFILRPGERNPYR